jgi:hypothetical protein
VYSSADPTEAQVAKKKDYIYNPREFRFRNRPTIKNTEPVTIKTIQRRAFWRGIAIGLCIGLFIAEHVFK